jgi:hypothetical protein
MSPVLVLANETPSGAAPERGEPKKSATGALPDKLLFEEGEQEKHSAPNKQAVTRSTLNLRIASFLSCRLSLTPEPLFCRFLMKRPR